MPFMSSDYVHVLCSYSLNVACLLAKFRGDRSSRCWDKASYHFLTATIRHRVWSILYTDEEYLVVFVIVQNLVAIDALVSIACTF